MSETELAPDDRPVWRVITALVARDPYHRTGADRHYFRCPAHNDRSPSLSVKEGADGRALVHCFAGCSIQEVCAALGLTIRDLFVDRGPRVPDVEVRFQKASGLLAVYAVKYPELLWLIEQVPDDRKFYFDGGPREDMLKKQYPHIPDGVWAVIRK